MLQKLKNIYHLFEAIAANVMYGFPSKKLNILAVTGTDGKTTTTTLLYHILKTAGKKVALISTVAAYIGDEEIDTGFHVTTPSPFSLQKLLQKIAASHYEYVVLETTSHGIDQNRVWGIRPRIAAITNVTHEHLDYHKTYESYLHTKAKLLLRSETPVLNEDAKESYTLLADILEKQGKHYVHASVDALNKKIRKKVLERFGGEEYNYQNSAVAVAIAQSIGIKESAILKAIEKFSGVPGRMEEVSKKHGIRVIVDFAHTPNALEQALLALRQKAAHPFGGQAGKRQNSGRLILVFGCAGLRDHTKRPLMGEIAGRLADLVVLTSEDPRTEDAWSIIAQIKSGVTGNHGKIVSIADRYEAIQFALTTLATSGDTVLITGKGHEKSMCIGKTEYPWSDKETVQKIVDE